LNTFAQYQINRYEKEVASLQARGKPLPDARLYIEVGGLNTNDWQIINDYIDILRPISEATGLLEGRGKAGRHSAIWEVIPTFDWLLKVFEERKDRLTEATLEDYPTQEAMEDHAKININLGWKKLSAYFKKLDKTPAYYTAVLLHPHLKRFCYNAWRDKPQWLIDGDAAFKRLWKSYKERSITSSTNPPPPKRVRASSGREDHIAAYTGVTTPGETHDDEYERWKLLDPLPKEHPLADDPIRYWLLHRPEFPRLAQFALDILTIPAASTDCERVFSEAGDLLEPRRSKMSPNMIAAIQCGRSWKRMRFKKVVKPISK